MSHIFEPLDWKKSLGAKVDESRCRHAVHESGRGVGFYQCLRKPSVQREVDGKIYGFCTTHDPVLVAKKNSARQAKYDTEWAVKQERWRIEALLPECKTALEQIAAGHNDPRSLANEVLAKFKPGGGE